MERTRFKKFLRTIENEFPKTIKYIKKKENNGERIQKNILEHLFSVELTFNQAIDLEDYLKELEVK